MICVEIHSNNVLTVRDNTFSNAVSDSIKHETVKFLYTDNWKDYQKTAVFAAEGVEPINVVLDEQNNQCVAHDECYIPFEVLEGDRFTLSVYGVNGDSRATTTQVQIEVLASGYASGDAPQEPTQDQYSQIMGIMNEAKVLAQSVRDDADAGVFNGQKGEKGEKGDTGAQGPKGDKGDKGEQGPSVSLDEVYDEIDALRDSVQKSIGQVAIVESVSGKELYLDDVSAIKHTCSCRLERVVNDAESNNIFVSNTDTVSITSMGPELDSSFEWNINNDGSLTLNGYTNAPGNICFIMRDLIPGEVYTFSLRSNDASQFSKKDFEINFFQQDASQQVIEGGYINASGTDHITFVALEQVNQCAFHAGYWGRSEEIDGISQEPYKNLILYPQLELGDVMTQWGACSGSMLSEPDMTDLSTVSVTVTGGENTTIYKSDADGVINGIISEAPIMQVTTDNTGVIIKDFIYWPDIKKYIDKKINQVFNGV